MVAERVLERLLPAEVLAREVPVREQLRHKLLSRYRAHGLLGAGGAGGTGAGRLEWSPHLATEKRLFLARP